MLKKNLFQSEEVLNANKMKFVKGGNDVVNGGETDKRNKRPGTTGSTTAILASI